MSAKGEKYAADKLTRDEASALIGAIEGRSSIALRNRALLATIYRGALRVSEAVSLRPGDVDLDTGTLRIRRGKGDKSRKVTLDAGALKLLGEWVERRDALGFDDRRAYLFCSVRKRGSGEAIAASYLRRVLPKLADEVGISKRVHPHILRHTRSAELAAEGVPMNQIQKILGHASLATTGVYLDHLSHDEIAASMKASNWRAPAIR